MKIKILLLLMLLLGSSAKGFAQLKEDFDSNTWQWTEYSGKLGKAYIINSVMRLESKSDDEEATFVDMVGNVATHAYLPLDPQDGFQIKCNALVEKLDGKKQFGLILDYIDDMNCLLFQIKEDVAFLYKMKEGRLVGQQKNQFKLRQNKKKTNLEIVVNYVGGELEFRVNDVQALQCKYVPIVSNGFGFFAYGKCKVDFDMVEILNAY